MLLTCSLCLALLRSPLQHWSDHHVFMKVMQPVNSRAREYVIVIVTLLISSRMCAFWHGRHSIV